MVDMNLIIDRIEGGFAVCENENQQMINISLADLPEGVREGNVLKYDDGVYFVDKDAEAERRARMIALRNSIFNE